jgi:uncharacterized phiE125 gp8 family phage protein
MSLVLTSGPAAEPLDLDALKEHCHVDGSDHDGYLTTLGKAARERVELDTGRALITQTWTLYRDRFPTCDDVAVLLSPSPVQAVNSITYTDTAGASTVWTATEYQVDVHDIRGRVLPVFGYTWPSTYEQMNAVAIEFDAGYGADGSDCPEALLHAMKLLVGTWFEHREEVVVGGGMQVSSLPAPLAYSWLIAPYRLHEF